MGNRKNKLTLLLVFGVFVLPMLLAWVITVYFPGVLRLFPTTNYGNLVTDQRVISTTGLLLFPENIEPDASLFTKVWHYVYLDSSDCNKVCLRNLANQQRLEAAQGRDAKRVKRIFVTTDKQGLPQLLKTLKDIPNLNIYYLDEGNREKFIAQFRISDKGSVVGAQRIYVVDPKARLRIYYEADRAEKLDIKNWEGMKKDMQTLLKTSTIG